MKFIDNIYIGDGIKNPPEVFDKLKNRVPAFGIYCICLSPSSKFFAEILSSRSLFSEKNKNKEYTVIGIAFGKSEAEELFSVIVEDYLSSGDEKLSGFKKSFDSEEFISV